MLPFLLAAALASSPLPAPSASPCPADLLVTNARLKVVRARDRAFDDLIVTVDVLNRGVAAQPGTAKQHLELAQGGRTIGSQPIPGLGPDERYAAAFRMVVPHVKKRDPMTFEFRYVLDTNDAPRANCTSSNDRLTVTLH